MDCQSATPPMPSSPSALHAVDLPVSPVDLGISTHHCNLPVDTLSFPLCIAGMLLQSPQGLLLQNQSHAPNSLQSRIYICCECFWEYILVLRELVFPVRQSKTLTKDLVRFPLNCAKHQNLSMSVDNPELVRVTVLPVHRSEWQRASPRTYMWKALGLDAIREDWSP